jgi:transcriptional regulator with XRE-family HTH domain
VRLAYRSDGGRAALERLGADIRQARYRARLSQAALAGLVGVHQTTILRLELGRSPDSRLIIYARIREELRLDGGSVHALGFESRSVQAWDADD